MSNPRILWVQDDYEGPMNGLVEYNGEKLWFSRQVTPKIVSSTEVPPPEPVNESDNNEDEKQKCLNRIYTLVRLSPEHMELIVKNHERYCAETGNPLNHGEPIIMRRKSNMIKRPQSKLTKTLDPTNKDTRSAVDVPVKMQGMGNMKEFIHQVVPSQLTGEIVTTIKEADFENYLVPRTFKVIVEH